MTLLAIDPGKRIGWAMFYVSTGEEIARGVTDWDGLRESFDNLEYYLGGDLTYRGRVLREIVCEDYIGRPGQKNGGQHFDASEVIGGVRMLAEQNAVPFHRQRAVDVLQVSALHAGYKLPKGHLPDEDSAWLHGRFRLEQLGVLRAEPLD
jgi:hypothetical protein